eukprot:gb/GECH01009689.1/.p1 GENE.gb/GECH01009689.1/~~gb/GECH01009689.1/.p1  ORF type:complete len:196 (+),score=32.01 gb/GECH01009689.1/:1-588(+)
MRSTDQNTHHEPTPSFRLKEGYHVTDLDSADNTENPSDEAVAKSSIFLQETKDRKMTNNSVTDAELAAAERYHLGTVSKSEASPSRIVEMLERIERKVDDNSEKLDGLKTGLKVQEARSIQRLRNSKIQLADSELEMLVDDENNYPSDNRITLRALLRMNTNSLKEWIEFYSLRDPHYIEERREVLRKFLGVPFS